MNRRPYYGWVIVSIAAASMVATLPARSVGLGLITEPLIAGLNLTRIQYAHVNVIATLLGSLFALIAGPLTDRWGIRILLSVTLLLLGGLVMAMGHWVSRIVHVAAELGLADHLASGPRTAEELAQPTGALAVPLYRLMRTLAHLGILTERPDRRFALTPLGEALKTGAPVPWAPQPRQ